MVELYKRFSENTSGGKDYIAGDIHGTLTKFEDALKAINFNPQLGDRLFLVGDLVDRGPESHLMLEFLNRPYVHAVRGNHEQMLIDWDDGIYSDIGNYTANGGGWAINLPKEKLSEFAQAFRALPLAIELSTGSGLIGIVHADCPFSTFQELEVELSEPSGLRFDNVATCLLWNRWRIECQEDSPESEVRDVRAVVVGHTPMQNWTSLGNHIYIDTMGWRGGEFTILSAETLHPVRHETYKGE